MNKGEAVWVNTVLRWIIGEADDGDGALSAVKLAERVNLALGAGVRPEHVAAAFNDPATRPRIEHGPAR